MNLIDKCLILINEFKCLLVFKCSSSLLDVCFLNLDSLHFGVKPGNFFDKVFLEICLHRLDAIQCAYFSQLHHRHLLYLLQSRLTLCNSCLLHNFIDIGNLLLVALLQWFDPPPFICSFGSFGLGRFFCGFFETGLIDGPCGFTLGCGWGAHHATLGTACLTTCGLLG